MILLALCCVVAAVFAWLVIPGKKKTANDGGLVVPAIFQAPQTIDNRSTLGPEAAKMAEKLVVLQQFADQKQKEKQVETVVKEFQELLK
jgi:ABC-type oligopeptide transport system substrate-binding subunit